MPDTEAKKIKEKDVKYDRIVMDELPDRPARTSNQEEELVSIKGDRALVGKAICIAQYAQGTAATAAANILRKRHGQPEVEGWEFATRKLNADEDGTVRTGLFVIYQPSWIKPGAAEAHAKVVAQRKATAKQKLAEKKAAGNGGKAKGKVPANA